MIRDVNRTKDAELKLIKGWLSEKKEANQTKVDHGSSEEEGYKMGSDQEQRQRGKA